MARNPCAIVVVTADVDKNTSKVFEAMGAGALDAVNTPTLELPGAGDGTEALLDKIQTIHKLLGGSSPGPSRATSPSLPVVAPARPPLLIAIGASAGGPAALAKILSQLPVDFPAAVVIIQHVDLHFAEGLATWLDCQTPLPVRLAREGDQPQAGAVLLAGTEHHLVFTTRTRLGYTRKPVDSPYRPSIDVFFRSVKRFWSGETVAVLLTGMGRDGAEGLKILREAGHHTIVQDRATSAVYGMPKAAAEMNAAAEILPLDDIGPRLITLSTPETNARF
jgi:two-component system response regulator WspF